MSCRIVEFIPGRRPTDEDARPGMGSSDQAAMVTGDATSANRAVILFETSGLPEGAAVEATISLDGRPLRAWDHRPVELTPSGRQRLELFPDRDLAGEDLGFAAGYLRRAHVELHITKGAMTLDFAEAWLDVCDVRNLGSLYQRVLDRLVAPDTTRQADQARVADPGVAYHPWYPVLTIGGDKAALYTAALVNDIVGKQNHLTDPAWLLRVGIYLELLTCIGIFEAVRDDVEDLLDPRERASFETSAAFDEIRARIQPAAWREIWAMRRIAFPALGSPRTGPVSVLNLLRKRDVTMRFLHTHHEDLKHAIELAGANDFNAQETWQRVFRDAERAVMRQTANAFPELGFLPAPAREIVLWQRLGFAGQQGVYPTACNQYRASMNHVADWAKTSGLMNYAGASCVPPEASLIEAQMRDRTRIAVLQRQDGLGPRLDILEPAVAPESTIEEIEQLLALVPIFRVLSPADVHALAIVARPLFLGPTQRFVVEGHAGTSLFFVGEGEVEVRLRSEDGGDRLVDTMGRGEVVGEMALLTGDTRSATVRSVGEAVVYEIGRQQFAPLLVAHPEWLDELAAVMEQRLAARRETIAQMDKLAQGESLRDRIRRNFFFSIG